MFTMRKNDKVRHVEVFIEFLSRHMLDTTVTEAETCIFQPMSIWIPYTNVDTCGPDIDNVLHS